MEDHVAPALVVFHTPPEAEPIYQVLGSFSTTSIEVIRPLIPEGPIFLGFRFLSRLMSMFCARIDTDNKLNTTIKKGLISQFLNRAKLTDKL
jgi:hypothetical protein